MIRSLSVLAFIASAAAAQVPLSGDVYDGHGGPLSSDVLYVSSGFTVPAGQKLTAYPRAIVKFDGGSLTVDGHLEVLPGDGSESDRMVMTSIHDDAVGGDTNGNGSATLPAPGQWGGLVLRPGSLTTLEICELRYYGAQGAAGIEVTSSELELACLSSWLRWGAGAAVDAHGHYVEDFTVYGCHIEGNGGIAIDHVDVNDIGHHPGTSNAGIRMDSLSGNGGDYVNVTELQLVRNVSWAGYDLDPGVLVFSGTCIVGPGLSLRLEEGAIVKLRKGAGLRSQGSKLELIGTTARPVVLTSFADDAWGGDTNGDGAATQPAPGDWLGVSQELGQARVDRALIRYADGLGEDGAALALSAAQGVTRTRIEHSLRDGFHLAGLPGAAFDDLVAWDCGGTGLRMDAGASLVRRATVVRCATAGIELADSGSGDVRSSISVYNGVNWAGLDGHVAWSNGRGAVGGTGNIVADPGFLDELAGDLRLSPASPCIDAGDPADKPGNLFSGDQPGDLDPAGYLRFIDGDLDSVQRIDMGAYEYDNVELAITGLFEPDGTLEITTTCHADFTDAFLMAGLALTKSKLSHYGTLWIWPEEGFVLVPWPTTSGTVTVHLPADTMPMGLDLQFVARIPTAPGTPGNLSNYVELPPPP